MGKNVGGWRLEVRGCWERWRGEASGFDPASGLSPQTSNLKPPEAPQPSHRRAER